MAPLSSINTATLALLVILCAPTTTDAFGAVTPQYSRHLSGVSRPIPFVLHNDAAESEDVAAAASDEEESTEELIEETEEEKEEESKEDAELAAIKKEIADLESSLKLKNRELNSIESMVDKFSQAGYARKVAEIDQLRKMRRAATQTNQFTERASVLQTFLPVLDELTSLNEQHGDNDFAKSYRALKGVMIGGLKDLKAEEFSVATSDAVDSRRVNAVEKIYSDDIGKGSVVEMTRTGWELEGNVMRLANVIVSLGSEADAKKAEEDAAAKKAEEESAVVVESEASDEEATNEEE
uniref:GrpE protein homolog n=1 Tax=Eucampia antarctica TaxID=49252 RepID=A0A7S2R1B9_9STRA|mmetsp:Transcript_1279/g.1207  ORF Transcript_1279/g.1207 Transcript_1279/m.1207 type:complete len:296 (+) Transcript_1279:35-922(+)